MLLERAAEVDRRFDRVVLAEMMTTLDRYVDVQLPINAADVEALRAFFRACPDELAADRTAEYRRSTGASRELLARAPVEDR